MSVECIKGKPYNKETDVWSLGIILYQLMTFRLPFQANTMAGIAKLIKMGQYTPVEEIVGPNQYSQELLDLVPKLLADKNERPKVRDFIKNE